MLGACSIKLDQRALAIACLRRKKAQKPECMNLTTWEALCRVWTEPAFIAKTKRGKTARQANKRFDGGPSVEERAIMFLEAQDRVTKGASLKWA
ncbi:agenet-like domain, Agenet domain [Artemisia annua]|uniref:Agenet-like domain, Agenet domain n=1 Tax=Artemisia annua TaxID=35608 RepID=A0A2U1N485_ARTAN|nr:agenet-like domain, Agenet domain [Artemisia annua]